MKCMKLMKVVSSYMALAELSQTKIPIQASYAIAMNLDALEADYNFWKTSQQKILKEHYTQIKDTDNFIPNDKESGPKAMEDLLDLETKVTDDSLMKIFLTDLGPIEVAPAVLKELKWMILPPLPPTPLPV